MPGDRLVSEDIDRVAREIHSAEEKWLFMYPDLPIVTANVRVASILPRLLHILSMPSSETDVDLPSKEEVIDLLKNLSNLLYVVGFDRCMNGHIKPVLSIHDRDIQNFLDDDTTWQSILAFMSTFQESFATLALTSSEGDEGQRKKIAEDVVQQFGRFGVSTVMHGVTEASSKITGVPPELLGVYANESVFQVMRIMGKWKSLGVEFGEALPRTCEHVNKEMSILLNACEQQGVTDFGVELSECIRRLPSLANAIAGMAFWLGFDLCITGKVPKLEREDQFKEPIGSGISEATKAVLIDISRPIHDALEALLVFCEQQQVVSDETAQGFGKLLEYPVIEMMLGAYTLGVVEATVKQNDIPVIRD